jgi:2-polyprenyl-3-methyl-5-hydroxy-6-metoxy-1,4-benzoquinol methylase
VDRYGFYYPTGVCNECGNVQQEEYYNKDVLNLFYTKYYRKIYGATPPKNLYAYQREGRGVAIFNFIQKIAEPRKVLEIGCGAGGILSRFSDAGCDVLGLDYDKNYLNEASKNNVQVRQGSIEKLEPNERFDLIILSHVLEHIVYPADFLKEIKNFLNDDGILYIEVPSLDDIRTGASGYDLLNYWQNAHTVHFTMKTLTMLCNSIGLMPIKITKTIHSCWKKSNEAIVLSEIQKRESLEYSKEILFAIEANRKSFKAKLMNVKFTIRSWLVGFLSIIGIKPYIQYLYIKFQAR